MMLQILTIYRILEGVRVKNLEATILFVDFAKAFEYTQRKNEANTTHLRPTQRNCCSHNDAI